MLNNQFFDQLLLDRLFAEAAERVRVAALQSDDSILQLAARRLAENHEDVDSLCVVAASFLQRRQPQRVFEVLGRDRAILANNAVCNRLAGCAALMGQHDEDAQSYLSKAVELDPCQFDSWTMLGRISETTGRTDWAIKYYQRAMVFDQTCHDSALALARLHAKRRQFQEAIHVLRVSILRDHRSAKLNICLGRLLERRATIVGRRQHRRLQQQLLEEACRCYETANNSAPAAANYVSQGLVLQRMDRFSEAATSFSNAVRMDPNSADALTYLANANVEAGVIEEALRQYQCALALDPTSPLTHFRYTRAKRFRPGPETDLYISQLIGLVGDSQNPPHDRIRLYFALAKVYDDCERYDEAWDCFDRGNRLKRGHSQSSRPRRVGRKPKTDRPPPLTDVTDRAIRFFTVDYLAHHVAASPIDWRQSRRVTPIFIVGMPRSGTTLTEQILSSHHDIAGAGELKWIERIRRDIIAEQHQIAKQQAGVERGKYPELLASIDTQRLREHADEYLGHLEKHRTNESFVTDKMPTNFMHLGMIAMLFPNAKIIHCRRDPLDVFVSCYCQNLNAPFCDLEKLSNYYSEYRRLMEHWQQVLPMPIHSVDYEELVTAPERNVRELIRYCELDWDEQCLAFHNNCRAVHTPSKWQVRQPMYSSSVGKWRRFESHLSPIVDKLATLVP